MKTVGPSMLSWQKYPRTITNLCQMKLLKSDIDWATSIVSEIEEFASQLDDTRSRCDCCSLKKYDNYDEGMVKLAAQSAVTKVNKLKSLIKAIRTAQSKPSYDHKSLFNG